MSIVTIWTNSAQTVHLCQLSDDPADGTAQEQITYIATLSFLDGFTCVSKNYTGTAPKTDPSLWRWDGSAITSLPPPPPEPTVEQVREVLAGLGMSKAQLNALFAAAAQL